MSAYIALSLPWEYYTQHNIETRWKYENDTLIPLKCFGIVWIYINRIEFYKICDKYTKVDELRSPIKKKVRKNPIVWLDEHSMKIYNHVRIHKFLWTPNIKIYFMNFPTFENSFTFILWSKVFALQIAILFIVFGIRYLAFGDMRWNFWVKILRRIALKFIRIHKFLLNSINSVWFSFRTFSTKCVFFGFWL